MDYKRYNDNELIYMVQENDEDSTNLLVKKYSPMILKICSEYYHRYDGYGYEFDDFYQEALSAFYRAIYTYNNIKGVLLYTYVNACIRRTLSSFSKAICSNRKREIFNTDISDVEYCIEDVRENPITRESFKELENIVKDFIYGLSIDVGAILELKINGFTYKEIGELLDIPMSSVEFKSRRARKILRNKVKSYYCK